MAKLYDAIAFRGLSPTGNHCTKIAINHVGDEVIIGEARITGDNVIIDSTILRNLDNYSFPADKFEEIGFRLLIEDSIKHGQNHDAVIAALIAGGVPEEACGELFKS